MNSLEELKSLMDKQEDLHPDLQRAVEHHENLGPCIKHPLVFSMMHSPFQNAFVNQMYAQKKKAVDDAWNENRWGSFVFLHERPYRLEAFLEAADHMSDEDYWKILGDIWTDSENIWQNYDEWAEALSADRADRKGMMDDDERKFLADLPDSFTIYRGVNDDHGHLGFSWSLSEERATWFAKRFESHRGEAMLIAAEVKKTDVIAYFDGRGEEEIVVMPESVFQVNKMILSTGKIS